MAHINFNSTSVLDKATGYTDLLIIQAIKIKHQPKNFNRDRGFSITWSWYPVTNMIKQAMTPLTSPPSGWHSVSMGYGLVCEWDSLDSKSHEIQMMGTEMVPKTLIVCNHLTRLMVQEDFIVIIQLKNCYPVYIWNMTILPFRFLRVPTMAYNTQDYWVLGLCPLSGILKKHKITQCFENWICFHPQVRGGRHLLWARPKKILTCKLFLYVKWVF
jgi:hypothetical protein